MGLAATLRSAMASALAAADDVRTSVDYRRVTVGLYDPATDALATTETSTIFSTFVYGLSEQEVDYFAGDLSMQKVIINYDDLGFVPEERDYMVIGGVNWQVAKVKSLPGGTIGFIVFIRRT